MDPFEDLKKRYKQLRSQYDRGEITPDQFLAEVQQLRTQDSTGAWWAINSQDGSFLRYDGSSWVPAKPPKIPRARASSKSSFKLPELPSNLRPLLPFAGLILSTSCGVLWTLYTLLRVGQGEAADCITPFILGGLPISLWIFVAMSFNSEYKAVVSDVTVCLLIIYIITGVRCCKDARERTSIFLQ